MFPLPTVTPHLVDVQIGANNLRIIPEVTLHILVSWLKSGGGLAAAANPEFSPNLPEAV